MQLTNLAQYISVCKCDSSQRHVIVHLLLVASINIGGTTYFDAKGLGTQFGRGAAGDIWWQQI